MQATQNPAEVKANETVLAWASVQRAAKAVREAAAQAATGNEGAAQQRLAEEATKLEAAGNAPAVSEAMQMLRTAQTQLETQAPDSRKGKLMFSLSTDAQRQSSRRKPNSR